MWCQQQGNKGRRKAESVINGAKVGAKDGNFRHAAGGGGVCLRGRRCWACWVRRQVWEYSHRGILAERQPARNCSKSKSVDLFSHHGRNGGMQVRVGIELPAEPRSKEATGLERHFILLCATGYGYWGYWSSSVPADQAAEEWPALRAKAQGQEALGPLSHMCIS